MSVCCRDILALPALASLRLVGGGAGLDRAIKWIYFGDCIDDMNNSTQWINGHELVIITGNAYTGSAEKLTQILFRLNDMNIAGFLINVGPYIPEIPPEVVAAADELGLPLFRLPWEVKLVNITHAICNAIISNEIRESKTSAMLEDLLFGDMKTSRELVDVLSANKLAAERGCVIGLCSIVDCDKTGRRDIPPLQTSGKKALQSCLDGAFARGRLRVLTTTRDDDVIYLAPNLSDIKSRLSQVMRDVEADLASKYPGIKVHTGIGVAGKTPMDLKKAFRQAQLTIFAARVQHADARVTAYEDLGLLSLLLDIEDTRLLQSYHEKTLGALVEYDRVNRTDLYQTLQVFYDNNCDMQSTAQALYVHKNTLKYRLERICEILGCNIRHTEAFLRIGVSLQVARILAEGPVT